MMRNNKQKNTGFTLIETLVAIFVLLLSVTGPLYVARSGLRSAMLARDQITAFYLAQDAMEYVKNVRDDNLLYGISGASGSTWMNNLDDCLGGEGCTIDTTPDDSQVGNSIRSCNPVHDGCDLSNPLYFNSATHAGIPGKFGFRSFVDGDKSPFSRVVYIGEVGGGKDEMKVAVVVRWSAGSFAGIREIVVVEYMSNWLDV